RCSGLAARDVERLAVESRERTELRRYATGIKRCAGGIAVGIDHRAREARAHRRRIELARHRIEPVDPPVRVLEREPARAEATLDLGWNFRPRLRKAHEKRCATAADLEPVRPLRRRCFRLALAACAHQRSSTLGNEMPRTARTTAPLRTRAIACSMSECR